jgi:hypothetical protein
VLNCAYAALPDHGGVIMSTKPPICEVCRESIQMTLITQRMSTQFFGEPPGRERIIQTFKYPKFLKTFRPSSGVSLGSIGRFFPCPKAARLRECRNSWDVTIGGRQISLKTADKREAKLTTELLPDGNYNYVYTNAYGQLMLNVFHDGTLNS